MFNGSREIHISGGAHSIIYGDQNNTTNNNKTYNYNSHNRYTTTSTGSFATIMNGAQMGVPNDIPHSQGPFGSPPTHSNASSPHPEAFADRDMLSSIPHQSPLNTPNSMFDPSSSSHPTQLESIPYLSQPQPQPNSNPETYSAPAVPQQTPVNDDAFLSHHQPQPQLQPRRRPRAAVPPRSFSGYDGDVSNTEGGQTEFESEAEEGTSIRKSNKN